MSSVVGQQTIVVGQFKQLLSGFSRILESKMF